MKNTMINLCNIQSGYMRRMAATLLTLVAALLYTGQVWADVADATANGSVGLYLYIDGEKKWFTQYYNVASNLCSADGYEFNDAPKIGEGAFADLGTVALFRLIGAGAIGHLGGQSQDNNWVAAKIEFQVVEDGESPTDGGWTNNYIIGAYKSTADEIGSGDKKNNERCRNTTSWKAIAAYKNSKTVGTPEQDAGIDILSGLTRGKKYRIYFRSYAQIQWYESDSKRGIFGGVSHDASTSQMVSATFTYPEYPTTVNIANAAKAYQGPEVELSGYLRYNGCVPGLKDYGFVYKLASDPSEFDLENDFVVNTHISNDRVLQPKEVFSSRFFQSDGGTALTNSTDYRYKAYVKSEFDNLVYFSEEGSFRTVDACVYSVSDTIYYTIDNTQPENPCELRFQSLANAVNDLKQSHNMTGGGSQVWMNTSGDDKNCLKYRPIVFEVAPGTYGDENDRDPDASLMFVNTKSIVDDGYATSPVNPGFRLIVRAVDPSNKPKFMGGINLLGARNVTLKNLVITRHVNISDHSGSVVELGFYSSLDNKNYYANWCYPGAISNSNIEILGCEIKASGFNCIHATGCDGIKFNECIFNLEGSGSGNNDKYWGASVKLMGCKNVQFTRNDMRGSHSTTLWLQHTQNMLIMNNVFWNDNEFDSNVAFIRPMMFGPKTEADPSAQEIKNIGVYYNTLYLEDGGRGDASERVDFLRFGGPSDAKNDKEETQNQAQYGSNYKVGSIHFKWNNCYSYDGDIRYRNGYLTGVGEVDPFLSQNISNGNFTENNFWGKADASIHDESTESGFAFGTSTKHVDVEDEVCKSTQSDPDQLLFKGSDLNIGKKPSEDVSTLNVANNTNADRHSPLIRSEGNDWTYGAFQQANREEIETIVWTGKVDDDWDNRANWETPLQKRITCANVFAEKLKVIIPSVDELKAKADKYGYTLHIPKIPKWDPTYGERGEFADERVAAGLRGSNFSSTSKFADSFEIEEGAAIKGVENLNESGTLHYTSVSGSYTAIRSYWVLVGGVIKQFNDETPDPNDVREVRSGDFFIKDQEPHVYMQQYERTSSDKIVPGEPFTDLKTPVSAQSAFGIYIPDQYGPYKLAAKWYYSFYKYNTDMMADATREKTFPFEGHFANDSELPKYTIGEEDNWYFVNNSYPANLNVAKLLYDVNTAQPSVGLNAKVYIYPKSGSGSQTDEAASQSWVDVTPSNEAAGAVYVKPYTGFVLYAKDAVPSGGEIQTTAAEYGDGSTLPDFRSANADASLLLKVVNTTDGAASVLNVRYEGENLTKAFSYNASTPEVFVPDGSNHYSTYGMSDMSEIIPLTIRNQQTKGNMSIQIKLLNTTGFDSVILEDRLRQSTYDLTDGAAPYFNGITPGDCEGRFYLNVNYSGEEEPEIITEAQENDSKDSGIDIFATDNMLTVSAPTDMTIERVLIYDMAGRMYTVPVNGSNLVKCKLMVSGGVYTVKAVTDTATETKKVIIK